MRLQHINEQGIDDDYQEAIIYIGKHCDRFLKDARRGGKFMWSGRKKSDDWFIGQVRKNRRPLDSSRSLHIKMDQMFLKKFGFRARSNVLFCSGAPRSASYYGNLYSIWPIGDYKFVYSPSVRDIAVELDNMVDDWISRHPDTTEEELGDHETETLMDLVELYTDKNIKAALKSGNEIMLHCDKYVALDNGFTIRLLKQLKARK